ncbi:hypothetical protein HYC85_029204 [Camellia sinensis]|uniref:Uncharacterized protein n=1 Tax=Camellia sinensis TaxID=4442 RepID=A0A7J7FXB8_CAMSI|nr:hypothetical protein HYC85_029204 [Camellia sinensis]
MPSWAIPSLGQSDLASWHPQSVPQSHVNQQRWGGVRRSFSALVWLKVAHNHPYLILLEWPSCHHGALGPPSSDKVKKALLRLLPGRLKITSHDLDLSVV